MPDVKVIVLPGFAMFQADIKAVMLELPFPVKMTEFPLAPATLAVIVTGDPVPSMVPENDAKVLALRTCAPLPETKVMVLDGLAVFHADISELMVAVPLPANTTEFPMDPRLLATMLTL